MFGIGVIRDVFSLKFSDYLSHDLAIRAAIGDCSAEKFRGILTDLYTFDESFNACFADSYCYSNLIIRLILSSRGQHEKLKVFYEVTNEKFYTESVKPINYALLLSCLNNDDEAAEYIIREQLHSSDFDKGIYFAEPLYFLMITGKYALIPAAAERLRSSNVFGASDIDHEKFLDTVASAAYFRDKEFLKAWFEGDFYIDTKLIIRLYHYPEAIEFIVSEFYDKLGFDKPVGMFEFIKESLSADEILDLAYDIHSVYGEDAFQKFAEKLRPINKTFKLQSQTLWRYTIYPLEPTLTSRELFLREFLDDSVIIVMHDNYSYPSCHETERLLKGHRVTYDMTDFSCSFFFWDMNTTDLNSFLRRSEFIFPECGCVDGIRPILDKNSKQLTGTLIKKGFINKDNYEEVLDYLVSEKLLNALAVINNSKIMK